MLPDTNRRRARLLRLIWLTFLLPGSLAILACAPAPLTEEQLAAYAEAKESYSRGDLAGAERELSELLARRKGFHQAELLLGKVYYFEGKLNEAQRTFARLLKRNARYHEAELWLIRIDLQQGDTRRAESRLEELLSFDPNDPRLLFLMGSLHQIKGDVKNALEFYQRAAAFGEELAKTHLESARIYYQFNLPDRALKELELCASLIAEDSLLREPVSSLKKILSKEGGTR